MTIHFPSLAMSILVAAAPSPVDRAIPSELPATTSFTTLSDLREASAAQTVVAQGPYAAWQSPSLGTMRWVGNENATRNARDAGGLLLRRRDSVAGFWMMEQQVTQGQWELVMGENPVVTRQGMNTDCVVEGVGPDLPVACVTWGEASEYAVRVSAIDGAEYRLPTQAEWDYANTRSAADAEGIRSSVTKRPVASRTKPAPEECPKNSFGVYGLDSWEWTADWYHANVGWRAAKPHQPLRTLAGFRLVRSPT